MEDDSWAWAPVPETGPLLSVEMKRRTTVGGSMLFTRQTGPLLSAETKRRIYRGRWRAPHSMVRLLRTRRPTPEEYDSWARAPVPQARSPWHASGEVFYSASGRQWGNPSLKRDSPSMVAILISALLPSSSPCSYVVVVAIALLDPPECLQSEVALNLVRNPLGWSVLAFVGRICVGVSPHGYLAAGEFVFFISKLPSGLALPIPSFFMLLLEGLGLQPLHVMPCFILQAAIIAYLRGMSVGAMLLLASSSSIRGEG
jgi:hypothetical protein